MAASLTAGSDGDALIGVSAARIVLLAVFLASGPVFAQNQPAGKVAPGIDLHYDVPPVQLMGGIQSPNSEDFTLGKHVKIEGPLVAPFKARKVWEFPRRLARLFNPFAKPPPGEKRKEFGGLESKAWSSIVGWEPGRVTYLDDTHHESQLRLISISTGK